MQVTIKGQPQDILVHTVSIVPEPENNALYMFHCINCGSNIQKYQGRVAKIIPVLEPVDHAMVFAQCRKCGNHYNFQTYRSKPVEATTVTLYTQPMGKSFFYCYAGRGEPMLIYTHTGIYSNVDNMIVHLPFTSSCTMPECHEIYFFDDLV